MTMIRAAVLFSLILTSVNVFCQTSSGGTDLQGLSLYAGKYKINDFVVQLMARGNRLIMSVPGAPLQELIRKSDNTFRTNAFDDEVFHFEQNGNEMLLVSQKGDQATKLVRVSMIPDDLNGADSQLRFRKNTPHFVFMFSLIDAAAVDHIARVLETGYEKIIRDLNVKKMPVTTVRIFPDRASFNSGINFLNAPANVMATSFGKDDFRMLSPSAGNPADSLELTKQVLHEFTHCVHLNIRYAPNSPRWLWEGVAMYESSWFLDPMQIEAVRERKFVPFAQFTNGLEYELGYVVVEAMKDIWGFNTITALIAQRGDRMTVLKINQEQFESKIYQRIFEKYVK